MIENEKTGKLNIGRYLYILLFKNTSIAILIMIMIIFGLFRADFLKLSNLSSIFVNSSYIGVLAVGMTFVLITGGIDLSIGSIMYLTWITAGYLQNNHDIPVWLMLIIVTAIGLVFGVINAVLIVKMKITPFLATLGTMIIGRGLGQLISKSYIVYIPKSLVKIGSKYLFGIPVPVFIFLIIVLIAFIILTKTKFGRQLYAVGHSEEKAKKAGINSERILFIVYIISALAATIGAAISIMRIGVIDAVFGRGDEFNAIAAAVLGGASLFGGVGSVLPGTLIGTLIIQAVNSGLVYLQINVYLQPIISALVIFISVLIDCIKNRKIKLLERRNIRLD